MITTYNSQQPGLNLVIMAGVHGDERCGLDAFATLLPTFRPKTGKVTFIIGNPKALALGTREFEANLNRMFRPDKDLSTAEQATYEYRRSRELMSILSEADALLDIHSSTTKQTVPFVICEKQSFDCVAHLPVDVVVTGIDALHPTGTDAFVNQTGGLGICIECGNHNDDTTTSVALAAINSFLQYFDVVNATTAKTQRTQRRIQAKWIYKNNEVFTLRHDFAEFEKIPAGKVIGVDGTTEISAPYDGVILFPHNRTTKNSEAFLFGSEC